MRGPAQEVTVDSGYRKERSVDQTGTPLDAASLLDAGRRSSSPGLFPYFLDSVYMGGLLMTVPYLACAGRGRFLVDHLRRQTQDIPARAGENPCVWVHGVSVGEILSARGFLKKYSDIFPDWDIVLSTTTRAGIEAGSKHYPDKQIISFPFDMSFLVKRAFDRIRPDLVIIVEHELWPNFLRHAEFRRVPVVIVNGRLSERSLRGYRWLSRIMAWPPRGVVQICVEDETSASGFCELGIDRSRVRVTGNIKFDSILEQPLCSRQELGLSADDWVLVAGSTHVGEEEPLIDSFCQLRAEEPRVRLVLAPRRIERTAEISRALERRGLRPVLWSRVARENAPAHGSVTRTLAGLGGGTGLRGTADNNGNGNGGSVVESRELERDQVLLVDTVGELHRLSGAGDVVFVGGSFVPFGGHNIIEPASLGRPVVIGPHYKNFRQVVASFRENDALIVVKDRSELLAKLRYLHANPDAATQLGQRAAATVARNVGASQRTFDAVRPLVDELNGRLQGRD